MAKKASENQTGTDKSYKPIKIRKDNLKKNMKLGSKIFLIILFFIFPFKSFFIRGKNNIYTIIKYR